VTRAGIGNITPKSDLPGGLYRAISLRSHRSFATGRG
jgi:hypothetical protein